MAAWNRAQVTHRGPATWSSRHGGIVSEAIKPETLNFVPHTYALTGLTGQLGLPCVTGGARIITQISKAIDNWSTISGVSLSDQPGLNLLTGIDRGPLEVSLRGQLVFV